ncbi:hypothetical protein ACFU53_01390 [Streptomyces sp. NPDC057474]|uniref:hypothetical protein n=1 Tax=Streptomyces sp. NPDC057474 TaxID=3346144 RepID=UPI0036848CC5
MALIYAFQDTAGHWHGDLDTPLVADPGHGTLTYLPVPGTPEAASPFAGQTLNVLFAVTDLDPGPVAYQLDSGGTFTASWHVHALLATPVGSSRTLPNPPDRDNTPEPYLELAATDHGRRYLLTATRHDDGRLAATLTVSTLAGDIEGELCGDIDSAHLDGLARLLGAATRATPVQAAAPVPATGPEPPAPAAPRRGEPWTDEDSAHLAERYRHERDFAALGREFGRTPLAIHHQLARLGLTLRPAPPSPAAWPAPVPKQTHAPTLEERRKTHSRSHEGWTEAEEKQLAQRCAQGATAEEMSREFGRTERAINKRLSVIGAQGPAADKARTPEF